MQIKINTYSNNLCTNLSTRVHKFVKIKVIHNDILIIAKRRGLFKKLSTKTNNIYQQQSFS